MLLRSRGLVSLLLLSSLVPLQAQDQSTPESKDKNAEESKKDAVSDVKSEKKSDKKEERIEVTGSRIRRIDLEGPKPIIVVDSKDLEKSGAVTLSEALNKLTVASFGTYDYGSGYGVPEGTQAVDLHGLGEGNTLVLLNGRRLVRDPSFEFVDLSVIPTAAVERVEILTGTASAIYGTDALAGVINIITKKDYDGMSFGYSKTKARFKTGDRDQFYVLAGSHGEKTSNIITMQWDESQAILAKNRPWYDKDYRSIYGSPMSYESASGEFVPSASCDQEKSNGTGTFCAYDYWDREQLQGGWQKLSMIDDFSYRMTDDTKLNFRMFVAKKTARTRSRASAIDPAGDAYTVSEAAINANHPEIAGGAAAPAYKPDDNNNNENGVLVQGRLKDAVPGTATDQTTFSTGFGLTHSFGSDTELEVNVSDSRIYRSNIWTNFLDDVKFRKAVFTGEYDVLGSAPKGDIQKYLLDVPDTDSSSAKSAEANITGSFNLAGKSIGYSTGVSHIAEAYLNHAPLNKLNAQVKDLGGGGGEGDRKANAIYGEINVPIVSSLEASVAARFDDYSDFGSTLNPMVGLQYRWSKVLFARANFGTGFKAPTLRDLHDQEARYYTSFTDYKKCNEAIASGNDEDATRYCEGSQNAEIRSGGNSDLDPQKSTSINVHIGFEPVIGTGLSFEYFNQQIKDQISSVSSDELLQLEADGRALPKGTAVIRDETTGDVTEIVSPTSNLSTVKTSGLSVGAYTTYQFGFGTLSYKGDYSYYLSYSKQKLPGGKYEQYLEESGLPRWRWTNTFGYGIGSSQVSLISNSNGRYQKSNKAFGFVGSYTNWDLNYAYTLNQSFDFELGGANIFNQGFPRDNSDAIGGGIGGPFYPAIGPTLFTRLNFHI